MVNEIIELCSFEKLSSLQVNKTGLALNARNSRLRNMRFSGKVVGELSA